MQRTDIQALRGIAIILVLFHHANVGGPQAGYLGVDIFFVVSGYLITGILKRQIEDKSFSFREFYFRRAKRLLPAAYVTFALTLAAAPFFLPSAALIDLAKQLAGAVTFTANIVLWLQTGYFEEAAALKPLLHVWSLSIEEQYYLLLPALLVWAPRRWWLALTILLGLTSVLMCLVMVAARPSATFYLLPTRGWELGLGSVGALLPTSYRKIVLTRWLFWPALGLIMVVPLLPVTGPHPGVDALLICTATLITLLRQHDVLNRGAIPMLFAKAGAISYSLYLVHWPLFAFANNAYVTPIPTTVRWFLIVLSVVLSCLLYRFVEQPFRNAQIRPTRLRISVSLAVSLVIIASASAVAWFAMSTLSPSDDRRANVGIHHSCVAEEDFRPTPGCQTTDKPRTLLWGDSYAMHLAEGLISTSNDGVVQATKEVCGPLLDIAPYGDVGKYNLRWTGGCISFNESVLRYLEGNAHIDTVVLASAFSQYLAEGEMGAVYHVLTGTTGANIPVERRLSAAVTSLRHTVDSVRKLGKRVVVVAPPPRGNFDIGRCLERKAASKVVFGSRDTECRIPVATYHAEHELTERLLSRVSQEAGVSVVNFDDTLCDAEFCQTTLRGTRLYRDGGHLSYDGSRALGQHMKIGEMVRAMAR